ncbi:hypothetical protein Tsubulata_051445 [Turnera subulata]|uniref:DUF4283 domain-containing protein n=1 Tax=Turnera subulata TaxID=218843 RepID=A0A9Q0JLG2_9ROSI|nr:hypothetical protein Tsubulata_049049 [Turnera subulata]KAJ4845055.1 hypothetical protein Tsubulata_051445 [Turnera subulata]
MKNGFIPNMVHHSVGRSFSQILGVSPDKSVAGSSNPIVDGANIIYNSGMESIQRMRSCAFGILRKPMALQEVQGLFCAENKLGVVVKPMGGKSVLVCMESGEVVNSFLKAQYPRVHEFFELLKPWEEGDMAMNRLCWVYLYGVPPHAWQENFFNLLGHHVGQCTKMEGDFDNCHRLDIAKLQVLTSIKEPIHRQFKGEVTLVRSSVALEGVL